MTNENKARISWQKLMPRGRSAIISMIIVAVVAFSLGGLLLGGGKSEPISEDKNQAYDTGIELSKPIIWTCSMHPQIQLSKPGKCPICFMDLIPVETAGGSEELNPNQIRLSETAVQLAKIQTTPAVKAFAERSIRMVGKLDYDESKVAYITAWVPGRLDKLFVDYTGAEVNKGDHLAHIYSPELIAAEEELIQAAKAIKNLDRVSNTILRTTAQETYESAQEKLRLYGISDQQIKSIEESNEVSHHQTITAPIGGVVVHKNAKEGMYVQTGTPIYTIADLSELWVLLEAYESDLSWLKYGQHLTFTSQSFPGETFNAIISFIDPVVNPRTRTVNIRAIVQNKDRHLKPQMFVSGTVLSRLDNNGNVISPELSGKWIGPMHPEIVKDHPGKCDICGMDLIPAEKYGYGTDTSENKPLVIPASAPLITGKRAVVYIKLPGDSTPVFEGREVTLGPRAGDYYIVKKGVKEGELVVTNGAFKIDSELQIHAKPSMMSPQGGGARAGHNHGQGEGSGTEQNQQAAETIYKAGDAKRLDDCEKATIAITPVYDAYFKIQMSLADDDLAAARKAFVELMSKTKSISMEYFKDEAHTRWMKISKSLENGGKKGEAAANIENARDAFYQVSLAIIELHDTFGHGEKVSYYLTYCPMARDNDGAYWLQTANIVWNSFFGKSMLRCGEIKQELKPGNLATE